MCLHLLTRLLGGPSGAWVDQTLKSELVNELLLFNLTVQLLREGVCCHADTWQYIWLSCRPAGADMQVITHKHCHCWETLLGRHQSRPTTATRIRIKTIRRQKKWEGCVNAISHPYHQSPTITMTFAREATSSVPFTREPE